MHFAHIFHHLCTNLKEEFNAFEHVFEISSVKEGWVFYVLNTRGVKMAEYVNTDKQKTNATNYCMKVVELASVLASAFISVKETTIYYSGNVKISLFF